MTIMEILFERKSVQLRSSIVGGRFQVQTNFVVSHEMLSPSIPKKMLKVFALHCNHWLIIVSCVCWSIGGSVHSIRHKLDIF